MNTAHGSRQHRQRLKMFLPANAHCPAMRLTEKSLYQPGEMSIDEIKKCENSSPQRNALTRISRIDTNFGG
jgi:hypothetical protein